MNSRTGITRLPRKAGRRCGFSLVELLLAVALLALLLGAVAFNFSTLQRGARLEEGANQIEALLRYARAQAAATGHRVRISFDEDVGEGLLVPLGNLAVTWEPDPLAQPDMFLPLPEAAPYLSSILDAISIEDVRPVEPANPDPARPNTSATTGINPDPGADVPAGPADAPWALEDTGSFGFPPITFYPDGSSDSAEITIAPRDDDGEDQRRMVIRLMGLTGVLRRRVVLVETLAGEPPLPATAGEGAGMNEEGRP